jgi:hypothetical protein
LFERICFYMQGLKWGGLGGSAPPTPLKWAPPPVMWAPIPITINHSSIIPLGSSPLYDYINLDKNYFGYCVFVSVPEMPVLCVGVQIISASRLFHDLDPAVAKALSPTFTRRVVNLSSFCLIGQRSIAATSQIRNDTAHRTYATPHERWSSVYAVGVKETGLFVNQRWTLNSLREWRNDVATGQ